MWINSKHSHSFQFNLLPEFSQVNPELGTAQPQLILTSFSPFKGNDHSDINRTADCYVIERVNNLGEDEGIELSGIREGPVEDSGNAVVKNTEDKEDVVKAGEDYQEVVEGVLHVIGGENVD